MQKEAVESHRLGIPLIFHEDVIHGYRTILPVPLGESCCWDRESVRKGAALAAKEAAAAGIQLTYAPMVDVSNDPRWGRIMETSGEDPVLSAALAAARVKGFQGEDLKDKETLMGCVKHFAGYAALRGGRDYQNTDFSLRDLQEQYLPPFQAAVNAGVGTLMCSYTSYDGESVTMNRFMNHDVLRGQLKFEGLLISDWTTLSHAVAEGAAADGKEAACRGMNSGLEMDMASSQYSRHLLDLAKENAVSADDITEAARKALVVKFRLGLFDDPYAYFDAEREKRTLLSQENLDLACELTVPTMVLLKNRDEALPIEKPATIAVVGPFASDKTNLLGRWSMKGQTEEAVSVEEGLKEVMPEADFKVVGCKLGELNDAYVSSAVAAVRESDIAIVCLGESAQNSGEAVTMGKIELPQDQINLLKAVRKCGKKNPSGKLTQTFPRHSGQIPVAYNERRTFTKIEPGDLPEGPSSRSGLD